MKFVKGNVLNVSDLTRSKKLSEILERYAGIQRDEIFIDQNARNRDGQAVISDLNTLELKVSLRNGDDVLGGIKSHMANLRKEVYGRYGSRIRRQK